MERIVVIGAGSIGSGIAQLALQHGATVALYDADAGKLQRGRDRVAQGLALLIERGRLAADARDGTLGRLSTGSDLQALPGLADAELVIESAPEHMALKREIFAALDELTGAGAILVTTTAALSVTAIAAATTRPERVAGMHFFNPVHAMKLVEIVPGLRTGADTLSQVTEQARNWGKTPLQVKNRPGFIVNRVGRPVSDEAIRILDEGVASAETVDALIKAMGFRVGPFALMDTIGLDVIFALGEAMYAATYGEPRFRPHPLLGEMVDAGLLGRKTGRGFYEYEAE